MTTPWVSRSHFLAIAAAATRTAVSRADARPPPAVVADAVFLPVGVIGVAGAERVDQIPVVFTPCVFIADQQRDRCASRLAFEDAGQDFDPVGFLPLGHVSGRAGFAAIQILLDIVGGQRQAWRATIDDAPDGRAVAFAERRHGKDVTKGIAGHDLLHEVELDAQLLELLGGNG